MPVEALISVVVPARNAAATLEIALKSLQRQDYRNWEAIVVDDGSTDATRQIVERLAARDPRFRVVTGPARGASAARNAGIAETRGQWLQFLDADDWLEPRHLGRMLGSLGAAPDARAAWCSFSRIMPDGTSDGIRIPQVGDDPFPTLAIKCPFTIHGVLVERELVLAVGGFDESLATCEDWDLWLRVARLGVEWTGLPDLVAPYRTQAGSLSNRAASLLEDGWRVIERGSEEDGRVLDPATRWRSGLGSWGGEVVARKARFALWVLAGQLAAGASPAILPSALQGIGDSPWDATEIVAYLLDGVVIGSQVPSHRLASHWPDVGPVIDKALSLIAAAGADAAMLRRLDYLVDDALAYGEWSDGTVLRRTLLLEREDQSGDPIVPPSGVDRVNIRVRHRGRDYCNVTLGTLGVLDGDDIAEAAEAVLHPAIARRARLKARLGRWVPGPARTILRRALSVAARQPAARRTLARLRRRSAPDAAMWAPERTAQSDHRRALEAIMAEAAPQFPPLPPISAAERSVEPSRDGDRLAFWEAIFATENPWNYDSPYEREKYERQLAMLPAQGAQSALELASAEGHFTRMLAGKVDRLLATDISETALARNEARNAAAGNVEFRRLDLARDAVPSGHDLIVCSEVLYYLEGFDELKAVAGRLADALEPGGCLLTAHAFVVTDDRTSTGFDWGNPYGAAGIARVLGDTPGLSLEASFQTELYRIDRYRKLHPGETAGAPAIKSAHVDAPLEPEVERLLLRGGTTILRSEVADQRSDRVPVLMYHGVADEGPAALARWRTSPAMFLEQVRWLRRNGYHTLSPEGLLGAIARREPFHGRPVVITFDDGQQSFADHAWPILRAHDFTPEMFIVTGMAGRTAEWDGEDGRQVPLMDVATIRTLAGGGVRFGSHFTRHVPANGLSSEELARELAVSRAALQSWLGEVPVQIAAPYTVPDARFPAMARSCGYSVLYGNRSGPAGWWDNPLDLPRIEVEGDWSLDRFVATLEQAR